MGFEENERETSFVENNMTLEQLHCLALDKRSVRIPGISKHIPAAFVISMPGRLIYGYIQRGMERYIPVKKTTRIERKGTTNEKSR